jgi:hypothetical protein
VMFLPWPLALGAVLLLCAPWLWRETRRAGWWPLATPLTPLTPAAEGSLAR